MGVLGTVEQGEPVDHRPVGQHDDLVGDRLVLALGVEDRTSGSQVTPSSVLRANHVGPWKLTDRSNARALELLLGEMSRSQTAYT